MSKQVFTRQATTVACHVEDGDQENENVDNATIYSSSDYVDNYDDSTT